MPSKKKKYNARFPPARIKKIMQSDEEVGKVAQAVPVIISRALELFVESLLKKAEVVTNARNAKTLTPSHLKQCILAEQRFDFLKDLVSAIPDVQGDEESAGAETPRSSSSNSPFIFPPPSATATSSSASTSSPGIGPPQYDHQRYLSQSSERPSASSYDPNQVDYRNMNTLMTYPNPSTAPHYQHESVIVSHSSILNPVGANSNPYIPIHQPPLPMGVATSLPQQQQLSMSQQFEYHLQHSMNLNPVLMGSSANSIPLELARRNSANTHSVIVFDNNSPNAAHSQYQHQSD